MIVFDIVIACILIWFAVRGFMKGIVQQLAAIAAIVLGIWAAIKLSAMLASFLKQHYEIDQSALPVVSFAIVFLIVLVLVFFIGRLIESILSSAQLGFINKLLGLLFSLGKAVLILGALIFLLNTFDKRYDFLSRSELEKTYTYTPLSKVVPVVAEQLGFSESVKKIEAMAASAPAPQTLDELTPQKDEKKTTIKKKSTKKPNGN
jgi:membrane protein required for colicin V production